MLQILARRESDQNRVGRLAQHPGDPAPMGRAIDLPSRSHFRPGLFGWSFIVCVALPTFVSAIYYIFIASHEYVSEAKFTIRAGSEENSSLLNDAISSISATFGMGAASHGTNQDIFIVGDYIRSRTIIGDIGGLPLLYTVYSRPDIDWVSRLAPSATIEKAWKYWKRKVSAIIDTPTGMVTLEVRAYTSEDAQRLAEMILKQSETLINDISERSRRDALTRARSEMALAEDRIRKARLDLLAFRNEANVIDPAALATSIGEAIGKLTQERLLLENNVSALGKSVASDSPTLRVLEAQIESIDKQIDRLKAQLTNRNSNASISNQIPSYENAQLEVQFAEKYYTIAQAGYEKARIEQEKQQLYLVTVDKPTHPQIYSYPKVPIDTFTVFASFFVLWSMGSLLLASVRDHMGD